MAVIVLIHFVLNIFNVSVSNVKLSSILSAIKGINAFNSKLPLAAHILIALSFAMTFIATCVTISGITGFTLPGIIVLPACISARCISLNGFEFIMRKSVDIFIIFTANDFKSPDTSTNTSLF